MGPQKASSSLSAAHSAAQPGPRAASLIQISPTAALAYRQQAGPLSSSTLATHLMRFLMAQIRVKVCPLTSNGPGTATWISPLRLFWASRLLQRQLSLLDAQALRRCYHL